MRPDEAPLWYLNPVTAGPRKCCVISLLGHCSVICDPPDDLDLAVTPDSGDDPKQKAGEGPKNRSDSRSVRNSNKEVRGWLLPSGVVTAQLTHSAQTTLDTSRLASGLEPALVLNAHKC